MKPFECVGSTDELRSAYHHRMTTPKIPLPQNPNQTNSNITYWQPVYANLPFYVPESNFNYLAESENQEFFRNFFTQYTETKPDSQNTTTISEQQRQNNIKADRILTLIERRKRLEQQKRTSKKPRGL